MFWVSEYLWSTLFEQPLRFLSMIVTVVQSIVTEVIIVNQTHSGLYMLSQSVQMFPNRSTLQGTDSISDSLLLRIIVVEKKDLAVAADRRAAERFRARSTGEGDMQWVCLNPQPY